ncbi:hypothetical protein MOK21_10925 [Lysinibacillus sp. BPa_S21]|nr:hypothetical protein [Lysinibacillus sp. BPa_S21]
MEKKQLQELKEDNIKLENIKNELLVSQYQYDINFPNINVPLDLIDYDEIISFKMIDDKNIKVDLESDTITVFVVDNDKFFTFLKRTFRGLMTSLIDREKLILSNKTGFQLILDLDRTIVVEDVKREYWRYFNN